MQRCWHGVIDLKEHVSIVLFVLLSSTYMRNCAIYYEYNWFRCFLCTWMMLADKKVKQPAQDSHKYKLWGKYGCKASCSQWYVHRATRYQCCMHFHSAGNILPNTMQRFAGAPFSFASMILPKSRMSWGLVATSMQNGSSSWGWWRTSGFQLIISTCFFFPSHAHGQSLRVCWCEPSHVSCSSICVYKHAPGFKLVGASTTTSAGWSGPRLRKHPLLHLIYFCKISHLFRTESLLGTHDCPLTLQTKLQDSPGLPTTTLMPNNFATEIASVDPDEFCCTEKQWWKSLA